MQTVLIKPSENFSFATVCIFTDSLIKTVKKYKFKDGLVKTIYIFPDGLIKTVLIYFLWTVFKKTVCKTLILNGYKNR
jgi:hypothetical protein